MSFSLTQEQVDAAISGHDLTTFDGWVAAAENLLRGAPDWTAIVDELGDGYTVKVTSEGTSYCMAFAKGGDDHVYSIDDGMDFDRNAWNETSRCWEGAEMRNNIAILKRPVFVELRHEQESMPAREAIDRE